MSRLVKEKTLGAKAKWEQGNWSYGDHKANQKATTVDGCADIWYLKTEIHLV